MSVDYRVGDVFDRLAEIPDASIDLVVTSPPFLALRSYLPADHPDKGKEIGSEATPAAFINTLLALTAELGRVLAPHGSICVELGDTYSGSGGAGGDYNPGGLREGQDKFEGSGYVARQDTKYPKVQRGDMPGGGITNLHGKKQGGGLGWPLAKSLTGIPTLYPWSLAYGRNLLTGVASPAGLWRIRNVIVWARPNPPVGALGDKFRPATSYITVACRGAKRFFDLDAVRTEFSVNSATPHIRDGPDVGRVSTDKHANRPNVGRGNASAETGRSVNTHAGAPPLDWHSDLEDGDWLWKLATQPYAGAHYATFPLELPTRLIRAMCPQKVCTVCGKPSERIVGDPEYHGLTSNGRTAKSDSPYQTQRASSMTVPTLGWSDCGHNTWRTGVVLDPFAGSGTTLEAAQNVGRHAIGIDLDERNADLARQRVGMFLTLTT